MNIQHFTIISWKMTNANTYFNDFVHEVQKTARKTQKNMNCD